LVVEDSQDDAFFIVRELRKGGFDPTVEQVASAEAMGAALERQAWDVIICDYKLPGFGGPEALALCQEKGLDIPFIIVSGAIGEEIAVQMMKSGAHDYVMKDRLARLPAAVQRELGAAQERCDRRKAEEAMARMAAIVESCEDAVIGKTLDGIVTNWNAGAEHLFGYTAAEMLGRSSSVLLPPALARELSGIYELLKGGQRIEHFETVRVRKDGTRLDVSLTISPIKSAAGRIIGLSAVARDISQRKREERERNDLIQQLSDSLARVKTLSGLLPICSGCKKIRNDAGYWEAVEAYLQQHTDAKFTHSLCQDCVRRLYPDIADEILDENGTKDVAAVEPTG